MTRLYLLLICILAESHLSYGTSFDTLLKDSTTLSPRTLSSKQQLDSMQIRKLEYEVLKLRNDLRWDLPGRLASQVGTIIAGIAVLWTIFYGIKNLRIQILQEKQKRLSELLGNLYNDSALKRAGAVTALTRYSNEVSSELLLCLRLEKDESVVQLLENVLQDLSPDIFQQVLTANTETIPTRIRLYGSLSTLKKDLNAIVLLLQINKNTLANMRDEYSQYYDNGKSNANARSQRTELLGKKDEMSTYLEDYASQEIGVASRTARIICQKLKTGWKPEKLESIDLTLSNLYRVNLAGTKITNSIFTNTIARHALLTSAEITESFFDFSNMFGIDATGLKIRKCSFMEAILRNCNFLNARINNCEFKGATISQSNFIGAFIQDSNFTNVKSNHASFNKAKFQKAILSNCEMPQSTFIEASLTNTLFYKSKLVECDFANSMLKKVAMNGADLRGASFEGATLESVDFRGANMKNVKIKNCQFINCKFTVGQELDQRSIL